MSDQHPSSKAFAPRTREGRSATVSVALARRGDAASGATCGRLLFPLVLAVALFGMLYLVRPAKAQDGHAACPLTSCTHVHDH